MVKLGVGIALLLVAITGALVGARLLATPHARWLASPGPLADAHADLEDRCATCHAPYRRLQGTACVRCHALADRLLAEERTRFHAYVASCVACHPEHQGRSARPTRMDHDALAALLAARLDGAVDGQALACDGCHRVEEPHGQTLGDDCASCHRTSSWSVDGFAHPSPAARDCARCHAAPPSHGMEHFRMSQQWAGEEAPVSRCWACHQTSAWNDILDRGWIDHH